MFAQEQETDEGLTARDSYKGISSTHAGGNHRAHTRVLQQVQVPERRKLKSEENRRIKGKVWGPGCGRCLPPTETSLHSARRKKQRKRDKAQKLHDERSVG